jgi:hypothetical protein
MRRSSLFWGAILILLGGLLLLKSLGLLGNVDIWGLLWPTFLILMGLRILLGRFWRTSARSEHANIPLEGAAQARVRLQHGAGRMTLRSGANATDLLEGDFGGGLDVMTKHSGDQLTTSLSLPSQNFPFVWEPGYTLDWSINFNRDIPFALEVNTGASESRIDLNDLKVTELHLQTGASSTDITLPANAGFTRVSIESGAASVNIRIPQGVAARIRSQSGLAAVTVDSNRFPRIGDSNQSLDYDTAANKAEIHIQTGVGAVDVR